MHPKASLSKSLKWFADHLLSAIFSLIVAAVFTAWGGVFGFSMSVIDYAILLLNIPTPLWATICLILLCGIYSILKLRQYQKSYATKEARFVFELEQLKNKNLSLKTETGVLQTKLLAAEEKIKDLEKQISDSHKYSDLAKDIEKGGLANSYS